METKEAKTFEEYVDQNPRRCIPNDEMKRFLEFAKKKYCEGEGVVNHCHCEDEEDAVEEVENYISDSMEALLLYKEFAVYTEGVKDE